MYYNTERGGATLPIHLYNTQDSLTFDGLYELIRDVLDLEERVGIIVVVSLQKDKIKFNNAHMKYGNTVLSTE